MIRPIVWTIAGSDSGGGAGIQADLKTMNALGAHGCSVIAALTAQNTTGVSLIEYPSVAMIRAQLNALADDLPPVAIKLGMLGEPESIAAIADTLGHINAWVVCDPVIRATTGSPLLEDTSLQVVIREIFPHVDLLTPNRLEVEKLTGRPLQNDADIEEAARAILAMGVQSVLIKGGHSESPYSQDYWSNGVQSFWLTSPRIETRQTHGTGCTLSAAITACLGLGHELGDALVIAKSYVNQGLRLAPDIGAGHGPLLHGGGPDAPDDLPWLTTTAEEGRNRHRYRFPACGAEPLGFYPVVPRAEWVEKLVRLGVSTIQLRIKDLHGELLEREIARACASAAATGVRLFINDHWELALKYQAYGVHLGQEDIPNADLAALEQAGLRLGISTHCYQEVARALAVRPSYMAIGPVFSTTTKVMRFAPQGLGAVRQWRALLPCPLVAIGGIFLENAPDVLATGVDSVAVVRDILQAPNLPAQVEQWQRLFRQRSTTERTLSSPLQIPVG